ncbi:unnamed protein product [Ectocarpus sp. CCAP 1310/34]|nr:unnamed protein product [Ectocarpus sp. CCAP 1310/34]
MSGGDTTGRDIQNRTASTPSARSHPHRDVVNHRRSVDVRGGFLSIPDANHVAGGGEWSNFDDSVEEAPDDSTKTRTEAATSTVGGKAHRQRWVWDEWDDSEASFSTSCRESKQPVAPRASLSEKTSPGRASNSSSATLDEISQPVTDHDRTTRSSTRGRNNDRAAANVDGGEATPAAMKAFEDVQATARAMKVNLKERRSEVLDLKTNLQRVRASNERRRAKVSERWAARMAAAAEERAAAADRHRAFARQLKGDVDALEEKLGGLERQASRFALGAATAAVGLVSAASVKVETGTAS